MKLMETSQTQTSGNLELYPGAGEMALQLRALVALPMGPGSIPSTHTLYHSGPSSSNTLIGLPFAPGTHIVQRSICMQNIHIH